ncbi:hypothetical protein BGZ46_005710, partial [Entomortierella lignicola]
LESWYKSEVWTTFFKALTTYSKPLTFIPGERCSVVSADRMNSSRTSTATRQAQGSKTDGLVLSTLGRRIEILAIEVGRFDKVPSGTKLLTDGVKTSKVMKDQFDYACTLCKWKDTAMDNLQVFGIQVSQFRVDILSLKRLRGRFYRLTREQTLTLPNSWTPETSSDVLLVSTFFQLRYRMEEMTRKIML